MEAILNFIASDWLYILATLILSVCAALSCVFCAKDAIRAIGWVLFLVIMGLFMMSPVYFWIGMFGFGMTLAAILIFVVRVPDGRLLLFEARRVFQANK